MTGTSTAAAPPAEAYAESAGSALAPGSAAAASERALRIVVLVWSAAWFVLMVAFEGIGPSLAPLLSAALLAVLGVGWLVVVLARLPVDARYVAVVAGTAFVQALVTDPLEVWGEASVLITWTNLAALCAGFLIAGARGRWAIVVIAAGPMLILGTRAWADGTLALAWQSLVASAAYALADGMAAHVAASAVRGLARETDAAGEALAAARGEQAARAARTREVERVSRVLHDTVLNTLGAVRRGIGTDARDLEALRSRCALDLVELRRLRDRRSDAVGDVGVTVEALLSALGARAEVLALTLETSAAVTSSATIPTPVADALAGAGAEALINVAKHSGRGAAELRLSWDGRVLEVQLADDGVGWSGALEAGQGVSRSIIARSAEAGVDALVATAPGAGTAVTLTWRASSEPGSTGARELADAAPEAVAAAGVAGSSAGSDPALAALLARVAVRAGAWITGLLVVFTAVFWGAAGSVGSVVALAILLAVLAASWLIGVRRGRVPVPSAYAALLVAATFVVTALPARDATTCQDLLEGWWGVDGAAVVLLSLLLLTRGWWWAAAGSAAMVLGALSLYLRPVALPPECTDQPAYLGVFELSIVAAILIFREALRRQWQRAADSRSRSDALRLERDVRTATERARDARVDVVLAATVPLLDTLARGAADPGEDGVRRQCATAESALRSLLVLGLVTDPLRGVLGDAVLDAFGQGSALAVMPPIGEPRLPSSSLRVEAPEAGAVGLDPASDAVTGPETVQPLRALLREVVDALAPDETVTAALVAGPEGTSLTLVSHVPLAPLAISTGRDLAAACLLLDQAQVGEQSLVEVRWQ
jgi:signal transduction histidine kinase